MVGSLRFQAGASAGRAVFSWQNASCRAYTYDGCVSVAAGGFLSTGTTANPGVEFLEPGLVPVSRAAQSTIRVGPRCSGG